jgi:hypothetical protein
VFVREEAVTGLVGGTGLGLEGKGHIFLCVLVGGIGVVVVVMEEQEEGTSCYSVLQGNEGPPVEQEDCCGHSPLGLALPQV